MNRAIRKRLPREIIAQAQPYTLSTMVILVLFLFNAMSSMNLLNVLQKNVRGIPLKHNKFLRKLGEGL